ncbi:MAG: class I SAM-dependent methyltransferase [Acidobacteriota bacterium]|nr:MAG: class I SAM-dependent methyltransferase [Acidobacteriota bacterium]
MNHPNSGQKRRVRSYEDVGYKQFWVGKQKEYLHQVESHILKKALHPGGQLVVDVGCGYGRFAPLYLEQFQCTVMVDYSMSILKEAAAAHGHRKNVLFVAADTGKLPLRDSVSDACLAIRVIHHLDDLDMLFSEMHRVLAPAGRFFYNYTNKRYVREIAKFFLGLNHHRPFVREHLEVDPMLFHTHPDCFQSLHEKYGFRETKTWNAGFSHKLCGWVPSFLVPPVALEMFLLRLTGWMKLLPLMYVLCTTRKDAPSAEPLSLTRITDCLACPRCGAFPLSEEPQGLRCSPCGASYPVHDRIYDFRLPDETSLETVFDERRTGSEP